MLSFCRLLVSTGRTIIAFLASANQIARLLPQFVNVIQVFPQNMYSLLPYA